VSEWRYLTGVALIVFATWALLAELDVPGFR